MGKTLWKSPNGKWEIQDDPLKGNIDWDDKLSAVARVYVTDGWHATYASIRVNGEIWTGEFMTTWDYFVPKTIEAKAFSLLRAMYKERKQKEQGTKQLPLLYAVIVRPVGTTRGTPIPDPTFYRTYELALKHAESAWKKLSAYQKSNGAFVNIGKLSEGYASAKDVPERFSYSLLRTVNADYFADKKRRN